MARSELERVTPESVGIPSATIDKLLTALEHSGTEMHGIMIIRHGKVAAEGWWSPYAPGMMHSLHSLTKTYAATAVCLAIDEGLVRLDDRLIDLFREEAPSEISENLKLLTVRDVLCMGCGMEAMPSPSEDWIRDFLATPVVHKPGTAFMYNSAGSNMLGAIVRKVSGVGLHQFLKPRLFDKIGIDGDRFKWLCLPDGLEAGGGGGFATTEDNARLMMLYLQNGVWDGERVLSEELVHMATTLQNSTSANLNGIPDCRLGYGFQMWMCRPAGAYRADGAMGQYSLVFPDLDMVVSLNETARYPESVQQVLDIVYCVLLPETASGPLPENPVSCRALRRRLQSLAVARCPYSPYSPLTGHISGKRFTVAEGDIPFMAEYAAMTGHRNGTAASFCLVFEPDRCLLEIAVGADRFRIEAGMDGNDAMNRIDIGQPFQKVAAAGWWENDNSFRIQFRWVETCIVKTVKFSFNLNEADIVTEKRKIGVFDEEPVWAKASMI
ncbi:serine hydrolase domain-containing protein [Paenibacillus humicola]|uniref:serine hydrolase domain-containing protein n=1 Tax=Paenibacillus humicola TaxID=3110540 RepID=UPI00237A9DD7|nr:serine hydrolase [Paenibacillus humicola]